MQLLNDLYSIVTPSVKHLTSQYFCELELLLKLPKDLGQNQKLVHKPQTVKIFIAPLICYEMSSLYSHIWWVSMNLENENSGDDTSEDLRWTLKILRV